ncbi:arginine N-succinyltransferase, partial [Pantoea vagans]
SMEFRKADFLSGTGQKAFIAELMPKHPLYIDYLSPEARAVIGQVHEKTAPARAVLEAEGFRYRNYIDIFDGGPTLECEIDDIRAIRKSHVRSAVLGEPDEHAPFCLVANLDYHRFRVALLPARIEQHDVVLNENQLRALHVEPGDSLRVVTLGGEEKKA